MTDPLVKLSVVPAYYLGADGTLKEALPGNRILADDFAQKWLAFRELAAAYGWELLIDAPDESLYTRAMFRTPEDQAYLDSMHPDLAGAVDASAHQAGHAVDLSIADMQATYSNFDYGTLVQLANQVGIDARLRTSSPPEPWHFDDNPRQIYGTTKAAVEAVGNTSTQVAQAYLEGMERPEEAAIRRWQLFKLAGVGAAVATTLLVGVLIYQHTRDEKKSATPEPDQAQTLGAVYA